MPTGKLYLCVIVGVPLETDPKDFEFENPSSFVWAFTPEEAMTKMADKYVDRPGVKNRLQVFALEMKHNCVVTLKKARFEKEN